MSTVCCGYRNYILLKAKAIYKYGIAYGDYMMEITGKYGTAKIFTDLVEQTAINQVQTLMDCAFIQGQKVRMMPDIHGGAGCTVGTTIKLTNKVVCPNLVGVDIGCGMLAQNFGDAEISLSDLDEAIRERIPAGMSIREKPNGLASELDWDYYAPIDRVRAERSLGTLGGGNHFIELDHNKNGDEIIVIHSGSRHLGVEVAEYYQREAIKQCKSNVDVALLRKNLIEEYKAAGRDKEIGEALKRIVPNRCTLADELCYVSDELYDAYIHDMSLAQKFAEKNRLAMMAEIREELGLWDGFETIDSIHNFINMKDMILRKGATSANKDEMLLIPINMRDGTLLCRGKGNDDWNCSAPHGAGRLMSRAQAMKTLSMEDYVKSMDGIYSTSINESTLDEAPMAYKPLSNILDNISPTAEVVDVLKPAYNFKASTQ